MNERAVIRKIEIDPETKFSIYVKQRNAVPEFMAYNNMKKVFFEPGIVFVPQYVLFKQAYNSYLVIEEVLYQNKAAQKWFEYVTEEPHNLELLAKSMVWLIKCIMKCSPITEQIEIQWELNDVFYTHPSNINSEEYVECFGYVKGILDKFCFQNIAVKKYLVQRDLYNNILVGVPWSKYECATTATPVSVIDFGETYKYTSIYELIAEIITIWNNRARIGGKLHSLFYSYFIRELKDNNLWDKELIKIFLILWEIRDYIWQRGELRKIGYIHDRIFQITNGYFDF